jgi:hypothetical protein
MPDKLTIEELEQRYAKPQTRESIFRLLNIVALLNESLIQRNYRVPPALHEPLQLTERGRDVYEQLRKRNVPYPEARLTCLLEFTLGDILVDPDTTDQDALISEIGKEIIDHSLLYPFIGGRLLYDKFYDLFAEQGRSSLTVQETQRLLKDTPQGVYQAFDLVTGPYGLLRSQALRSLAPNTDVRLRHCPDPSCDVVHVVVLSTDHDAEVNKSREPMRKLRDQNRDSEPVWKEFLQELAAQYFPLYKDWALESVLLMIGEALTDKELRYLFAWLFDNTNDYLRLAVQKLGLNGDGSSISETLDRAQLLQLIYICGDQFITKALDTLVRDSQIRVPSSEIRTCVINRRTRFGRHGLYAQLGPYGVRVQASSSGVASLRARRLVESMYRLNDVGDAQELEWQLRGETSEAVEAKLENYLQTNPLRKSLGSLILARKSNAIVATEVLGLAEAGYDSDESFLSAALWKLGFTIDDRSEPHAAFWRLQQRMLQQSRRGLSGVNSADREEIRGIAGSYFVELEHVLDDSLSYTTWALTNDHFLSARPFVYRPALDRFQAMEFLSQRKTDEKSTRLVYGDKNTLFPLIHGFERLCNRLVELEADGKEHARPSRQLPDWLSVQTLERFPFLHSIPFLDLIPYCRDNIKRVLGDITGRLKGADVSDIRNEWLHDRSSMASLDRLREALDSVGEAVRAIEENGFSRQLYVRIRDDLDGDGRRTVVLANASGREISFFRPSSFAWLRLPSLASAQYVMNSARFAEPTEALRFVSEVESPYSSMWDDYPRRPRLESGSSVIGNTEMSTSSG